MEAHIEYERRRGVLYVGCVQTGVLHIYSGVFHHQFMWLDPMLQTGVEADPLQLWEEKVQRRQIHCRMEFNVGKGGYQDD